MRCSSGFPCILFVQPGGVVPANGFHVDVHVADRRSAEVHVIGVFVHVEHQHGTSAGERRRVIGGPLVDEPPVARRIGEDHLAGAAAFRLAHGGELRQPPLEAAEVMRDRVGEGATEAVEIDFVQDHRVRRHQLFAL